MKKLLQKNFKRIYDEVETVIEQLRSVYSEHGKVYYEDGRASTKLLESIFNKYVNAKNIMFFIFMPILIM